MKLFQRTLWSFVGVIALQAALAGAALSTILGSMQAEDAAREMSTEAMNAYDSFNAWKLAFWKDINELAEDARLARTVGASEGSPAWDSDVARELSLRLSTSAAAAMAVRDEYAGISRYADVGKSEPDGSPGSALPDPSSFSNRKDHPYVEIVSARGGLWFVGAVRISGRPSGGVAPARSSRPARKLDIFIIKKIDELS